MGAWKNALFLQEKTHVHKIPPFRGGGDFGFFGGGGSADFIFMGARIFLRFATRFARIDPRESLAIETPIFIVRQANSHESLESPNSRESPDSRESCESIRANHATKSQGVAKCRKVSQSIVGRFPRRQWHVEFSPCFFLATTAFGCPEGSSSLAIIAFGFIVRKYYYRLGKIDKRSLDSLI